MVGPGHKACGHTTERTEQQGTGCADVDSAAIDIHPSLSTINYSSAKEPETIISINIRIMSCKEALCTHLMHYQAINSHLKTANIQLNSRGQGVSWRYATATPSTRLNFLFPTICTTSHIQAMCTRLMGGRDRIEMRAHIRVNGTAGQ